MRRVHGVIRAVVCVVCRTEARLKNQNEEAAAREAVRKGWQCVTEHGWVCPDCVSKALRGEAL